jgi:hypothetical protein
VIRGASALALLALAICAGCGLGRPPSPTVDAGPPPLADAGVDSGAFAAPAPLPSADDVVRLAEETIRGGHAARVHDGHVPFTASLDLPDGGCGRVAFVADQAVLAQVEDATGARGDVADAGARVLTLVPPAGPVCAAAGAAVTLHVTAAALAAAGANVRWTTVTR